MKRAHLAHLLGEQSVIWSLLGGGGGTSPSPQQLQTVDHPAAESKAARALEGVDAHPVVDGEAGPGTTASGGERSEKGARYAEKLARMKKLLLMAEKNLHSAQVLLGTRQSLVSNQ